MTSDTIHTLAALLVLVNVLTATACPWHKCTDDFAGSTVQTIPVKLEKLHLKPYYYDYRKIVQVPQECFKIKGILAHACALDVAPTVRVNSFNEVTVHRNGAPANDILIDITVFCQTIFEKTIPVTSV